MRRTASNAQHATRSRTHETERVGASGESRATRHTQRTRVPKGQGAPQHKAAASPKLSGKRTEPKHPLLARPHVRAREHSLFPHLLSAPHDGDRATHDDAAQPHGGGRRMQRTASPSAAWQDEAHGGSHRLAAGTTKEETRNGRVLRRHQRRPRRNRQLHLGAAPHGAHPVRRRPADDTAARRAVPAAAARAALHGRRTRRAARAK